MEKFDLMIKKPTTSMKEEKFEEFETQFRTVIRRKKMIRMVPKVVITKKVEFDTKITKVPTTEFVTQ